MVKVLLLCVALQAFVVFAMDEKKSNATEASDVKNPADGEQNADGEQKMDTKDSGEQPTQEIPAVDTNPTPNPPADPSENGEKRMDSQEAECQPNPLPPSAPSESAEASGI